MNTDPELYAIDVRYDWYDGSFVVSIIDGKGRRESYPVADKREIKEAK